MTNSVQTISNCLLSVLAGLSSFVFTLLAFMLLTRVDYQLAASVLIGLFALLIVWVAAERPNSGQARAVAALIERLMAVRSGDLVSPAPPALRSQMPDLASAVDVLFDQVRSTLDSAQTMAMYDPVTSLPNRLHFKREAERILAARTPDDRTALLFIDLDGFKEVNDRLGHAHGDQVLVMVANRLRVVIRAERDPSGPLQPLLARLAGDEFTVLLPSIVTAAEAQRIAERARSALSEPFRVGDHRVNMGASIGIAICPDHGTDLTSLMKAADIAMYHAKGSGRARAELYERSLAAASEEKAAAEAALRKALQEREFQIGFEPRVCARTGLLAGGEALIRWNRAGVPVPLPPSFITVAEDSSLILDIGDWLMEAAVESLGRAKAAGLSQRLSFTVSPRRIERPDFFRRVEDAIERSGAEPTSIELEIAEATAMQCDSRVFGELQALRERGVSVVLGGFGSGRSSLARLKDIPLDRLKFDSGLIREIDSCDEVRAIVSGLVHIAHGIGCEAVASGVERSQQLDVLRAIGCDYAQGPACVPAMSEDVFIAWAAERREAERLAS